MGEKTDRAIRSLRERLNGKGKPAAWFVGAAAVLGAFGVGLDQGWVAVGFETMAHAAQTYETREHAAEVYSTKEDLDEARRASDIAHIRMQGAIDTIEREHDKQDAKLDRLQRGLDRLLGRFGLEEP